jgi:hypothetical protein
MSLRALPKAPANCEPRRTFVLPGKAVHGGRTKLVQIVRLVLTLAPHPELSRGARREGAELLDFVTTQPVDALPIRSRRTGLFTGLSAQLFAFFRWRAIE